MLSHYIEEEGVPTTGLSLVRLHTEIIKPPRSVWVPFEFGRPLGAPNNPEFQKKVLLTALRLLESSQRPAILVDFPEKAPISAEEAVTLACPYVPKEEETNPTELEKFCQAFKTEMASLRPWYDLARQRHQRTTVGASRLPVEELPGFICSFLTESQPKNPRQDVSLAFELRYAADDLKAYYNEAVTAQPGMATSDSQALAGWFWKDTVAGKVLLAVREACLKSADKSLQGVAGGAIVPRAFSPPRVAPSGGAPPAR